MSEFVSVDRINALKSGIESKTGETYADLTEGVQALMDGYGQGGEDGGGGEDGNTLVIKGAYVVTVSPAIAVENVVIYADLMNETSDLSRLAISQASIASVNHKFKTLTLTAENITDLGNVSCRNGLNGLSLLEEISFHNVRPKNFYQAFQCVYGANATSLKSIYNLDYTLCGGGTYRIGGSFGNQSKLENITLLPNTCGKLDLASYAGNVLDFSSAALLTDDSLISIANGLCADNVSTLTFHATPKARCGAILGTVSQVTDEGGVTYDFFTADSAGTVTLTEFITNTKGWTLA